MTPAESLVIDAVRAGVLLIAAGDTLQFKARVTMPPALAARVKASKGDVLALLAPAPALPADPPVASHTADAKHGDFLGLARETFGPVTVVSDEPARTYWRRRVKAALLPVYRADPDRGIALRDQWAERIAITTADGQSEADAERMAWDEVKIKLDNVETIGIIIPSWPIAVAI